MELTLHELTFLYQIMDVKRIAGFDAFPKLTPNEVEEVQILLADKDILCDNLLTENGLRILDILSLHVKTNIYYKFGEDTIFSNYADNEYLMLKRTDDKFTIELLPQELLVATILMKFKHWEVIKEGKYKVGCLNNVKFREYMKTHEHAEAMTYYKVDLEAQKDKTAIIFLADGYFQHYDAGSGTLEMYPRALVQHGIESIFEH